MATLQRSNVEVARSSLGLVQSPADSPWRTLFLQAYIQAGSRSSSIRHIALGTQRVLFGGDRKPHGLCGDQCDNDALDDACSQCRSGSNNSGTRDPGTTTRCGNF